MRPRLRNSPDRRPSPSRRSRMSNGHLPPMGPPPMGPPPFPPHGPPPPHHMANGRMHHDEPDSPTPICRCRVLYLGSAVPHVTKDGLQGIQEPLKELYPDDGALGAKGIDSWLSVWSNGFLLENVDENRKKVTRFFPIESLHYCAAVRYVLVPGSSPGSERVQRFLPLDSPFARNPNVNHPPLFAAILRRTTGIKVLECHVFICKRETAANALVRCAFHAYADSTYAKHLENGGQSIYGTIGGPTPIPMSTPSQANGAREYQQSVIEVSEDSINSIEKVEEWNNVSASSPSSGGGGGGGGKRMSNAATPSPRENGNGGVDEISVVNGDENHKVWTNKHNNDTNQSAISEGVYDYGSTMRSFRSSASGLSHRNRPRQMMMPSSPPPPPIPEELQSLKEDKRDKKRRQQRRSKSRDNLDGMMLVNGNVPRVNGNSKMGSRKQSVNSLAGAGLPPPHPNMRMNGHGPPRGGGGPPMMPPPPMMMGGTLPPNMKKAGTFSARGKHSRGMPPPFMMFPGPYPPPPHLMPPPGHPLYGAPPMGRPGSMEEPIYMPHSARPTSPLASYQPGHFPHEAYYNQQQYATIDKANKYRKNKKNKAGSKNGGSKHQSSDSNADNDSELNAGIYKKGHINERAFSYSIRNEHRSRSYGSLANVPMTPNGEPIMTNGGDPRGENGDIHHMMSDLDLGEDHIERSEVPPGLYHPGGRGGHHPNMYGPTDMMMMPDPIMAGNGVVNGKKKR